MKLSKITLTLVVEVKLEMLLNVYLTWQLLLLKLVLRLLGQLSPVVCSRRCFGVRVKADCTGSVGQVLDTCCRDCMRGEGRLYREIGRV